MSPPAAKRIIRKRYVPKGITTSTLLLPEPTNNTKESAQLSNSKAAQHTPPNEKNTPTLLSLGTTRSKTHQTLSNAKEDVSKKDPPQDMTEEELDEVDNEIEELLSGVKVKPKSKKQKEPVPSSGKRKASRVLFESPEPAQVTVVEPDEAPGARKINHLFKTVLSTTVRVDKVKDVLSNFIEKMTNTLAFLRAHVDDTMAILPKDPNSDFDHIVDKPSFPTVVFLLGQRYSFMESRGGFNDATRTTNGQTIKLSLVMGSTVEITHQFLDEVRHDTSSRGVNFWYKPYQEVDTTTRMVFLGAPNNANKEEAKDVIDRVLQPLEKHLLATDPQTYKPEIFDLPWPNFAVVSEQPAN